MQRRHFLTQTAAAAGTLTAASSANATLFGTPYQPSIVIAWNRAAGLAVQLAVMPVTIAARMYAMLVRQRLGIYLGQLSWAVRSIPPDRSLATTRTSWAPASQREHCAPPAPISRTVIPSRTPTRSSSSSVQPSGVTQCGLTP